MADTDLDQSEFVDLIEQSVRENIMDYDATNQSNISLSSCKHI